MFDRFTDKAKKSMNLARIAAQKFGCDYLAPEHMLHGVLSVGECRASQILASRAVLATSVLVTLERHIVRPTSKSTDQTQLPFTADAKLALEKSMQAASEAGHKWIGTEHILLGLFECGSGMIAEVFREHSLTSELLKQGVMDPSASPEDGPMDPDERNRRRRITKQQEQELERAMQVALELGDEPAARAIWGLMNKLST